MRSAAVSRPSWRWLLVTLFITVASTGAAVVGVQQTALQLRADTPVRAVVDDARCEATFTDPEGVERSVVLRAYNGGCLEADADGATTVHYDADDPSVAVPRRIWPLSAAGAVAVGGLAALSGRAAVRAATDLRRGAPPPPG